MDTLQSHSDAFERGGIDEAFLDVTTTTEGSYDKARTLATNLKQLVFSQQHITCSIGIAPNKLVAKIASDHVKPDGLTVVEPERVQIFLDGPVSRIPGVGRKVAARLEQFSVRNIDELKRLSPVVLHEAFGKSLGTYLFRAARGEDDDPVRDRELPTQLSRIGTLKQNTRNFVEIESLLEDLAQSVAEKLAEKRMMCKSVSIIAILDDLTIHTKSTTLDSATRDVHLISEYSKYLMRQFLNSMPQAVLRRVGVKLSGIMTRSGQTNINEFLSN
jgi:DNA polymerase IV (DinB-like DNA polymerase)